MSREPLFILGAGFNVDTVHEIVRMGANSLQRHDIYGSYPLVSELAELCFGLSDVPSGVSIEDLFQQELDRGNPQSMRRLVERIQYEDYHLAWVLSRAAADAPLQNRYFDFFSKFKTSNYLTFNYDSLPELFLMRLGRWDPRTGYGVRVKVGHPVSGRVPRVLDDSRLVLHLHGSFCLETEELSRPKMGRSTVSWIAPLPEPEFYFEPGPVASCFSAFQGARVGHSQYASEWVVAPVPNKACLKVSPFIKLMYQQAQELALRHSTLVAIGYSFNQHDSGSFEPILRAAAKGKGRVVIVSPDARATTETLSKSYAGIVFVSKPMTFSEWADLGYPDVESA